MTARKKKSSQSTSFRENGKWLFALVLLPAIEAVVSVLLVFAAPSEGANARFLGLSTARWVLVASLFVLFLFFCGMTWLRFSRSAFWSRFERKASSFFQNQTYYIICIISLLIVVTLSFTAILLTFKFTDLFVLARLQRVFPFILWIFLFSLQSIVILPNIRTSSGLAINILWIRSPWLPGLITFFLLVFAGLFIELTGIGLQPDKVGWDNPGVPLLETQIFIALILAGALYGLLSLVQKTLGWKFKRIDLLAAAVLLVFAIWSWQSQPLTPTFFSPTPRAPNYEFYPYSDAATHDLGAQNLVVGNGFPDVIEKPLYSLFLAGLHTVVGQDYQNVIFAQIAVLALFPVVLYLLGSQFLNRFSGALLAFTVILREANGIVLSGDIRVSHSKLLMTDFPAALGIAAFTLLLLGWFQAERQNHTWLIGIGGALGFLTLLRSQAIIFLPALLMVAFFLNNPKIRRRFLQAGLVLLGFVLVLLPWLIRNYQIAGQFGYSQPLQAEYLAKQYSLTPELGEAQFPQGTPISDYVSLGFSKVATFTLDHPSDVIGFVSAHFFHNEISSLLALPMRFDFTNKLVNFYNLRSYWIGLEGRLWTECCSLDSYITQTPYWQNWNGNFPTEAWPPIFVNLSLISIGFGAAWKKIGWLILIPVGIHLLYNASTAIARVSGWRLIMPVDWVLLLFYCLGVSQIIFWLWKYLIGNHSLREGNKPIQKRSSLKEENWSQPVKLAAAIFFVALLLPLSEVVIPSRYQAPTAEDVQRMWDESELSVNFNFNASEFLSQPKAEALVGRALYPRFYDTNEGEPGGQMSAFDPLPLSRVAFSLVGEKNSQVAFPLELAPAAFPNASDVLVIGCEEENYFRAAAVLFMDNSAPNLMSSVTDPFSCP